MNIKNPEEFPRPSIYNKIVFCYKSEILWKNMKGKADDGLQTRVKPSCTEMERVGGP